MPGLPAKLVLNFADSESINFVFDTVYGEGGALYYFSSNPRRPSRGRNQFFFFYRLLTIRQPKF